MMRLFRQRVRRNIRLLLKMNRRDGAYIQLVFARLDDWCRPRPLP